MNKPDLKLHQEPPRRDGSTPMGASYVDTLPTQFSFSKMSLALLPITPVPFTGSGAIYAWSRLIIYGGIAAYALSKKKKTLAIVFGSAAGLSVVTSLTAKAWDDQK